VIHWTGRGYLAIVVPMAVVASGALGNASLFDEAYPQTKVTAICLILSSLISYYLLRSFPSLRMSVEPENDDVTNNKYVPDVGKVESPFELEKIVRFIKKKRVINHSLMWFPLEFYVLAWGGLGIWMLVE
jgi:hypothetical protein